MNRKAMEMSLNFLVTIIIAIVIFMMGIRFIYNLASEADDIQKVSIDKLDERLGTLLCDGTDRVCIAEDRKTIQKGKFDVFGINIVNIQDAKSFDVIVTRPSPGGYTKNNQPIVGDGLNVKPNQRSVFLERNGQQSVAVGIQVPKTAKDGTYIFNVEVKPYNQVFKFYVDVP